MRSVSLLPIFLLIYTTGPSQGLSFYQENITMKITKDFFHVTGIYYLRNDKKSSEILIYPYPVDSLYGPVDSICIYNMTTHKNITPLKTDLYKTVFKLDFSDPGDLVIQISYRQKLNRNRAEYILKSTIAWKQPLNQANYQLMVPSGLQISSFSMTPHDSIVTDQEVVYLWNKFNYMPTENLIFEYKNR